MAEEAKGNENVILVGKKPTMAYVLAAMTQFTDGKTEVHIKARGRAISRAVDVAEVLKNRFAQGVKCEVNIGTEEVKGKDDQTLRVSTIDIILRK
ncbi:MAG: DNA-binding protein Alba [Candidatus Aenigmatarchaeota archaeon]|nr:MAG: DNA-binding protein Alba [Candidatus Aenigmarchaeota archaeon]